MNLANNELLAASSINSIDDFKQWTKDWLRPLFPHAALLSGLGQLHAGGVNLDYVVTVDYPIGHIEAIRNRAGAIDTPILRRWLTLREPLLFDTQNPWLDTPENWRTSFQRHNLRNIAAHGVIDAERCLGTYHSFYRIPGQLGEHHLVMLRRLTPLLHEVLCRVIGNLETQRKYTKALAVLTAREREVLHWLMLGKTNRQIARLAALSENTVKHHLTACFRKLPVENRVQLIRYLNEHQIRSGQSTQIL